MYYANFGSKRYYGAKQTLIEVLAQVRDVDMVLVAGDITTHGTPAESEETMRLILQYCKTVYAVAGNMDSPAIDTWLKDMGIGIGGKGRTRGEVGVVGVSAAPKSILHTPYEVTEDVLGKALEDGWKTIENVPWKIILSHTPPYNTVVDKIRLGIHVGSTALRSFIEERKPQLVICGHIHEARGIDSIGETCVLNCGSAAEGKFAIIEIKNKITVEMHG